jgi:hypothetical protein
MDQSRFNPKQEELSEEIRIIKRKLDDAVYEMKSAPRPTPVGVSAPVDTSRFEARLE